MTASEMGTFSTMTQTTLDGHKNLYLWLGNLLESGGYLKNEA